MKKLVLCLLLVTHCGAAPALNAGHPVNELIHRSWTAVDGIPDEIEAITQTADGTLWFGGSRGLYRFDGTRPVRYTGASDRSLRSKFISALTSTPDGGLWIGFQFGDVAFVKDGRAVLYGAHDGLPSGTVWDILRDSTGAMWAVCSGGLARLHGKRWETILSAAQAGSPISGAALDPLDTLWLATADRILARRGGEREFREITKLKFPLMRRADIRVAPDGSVWVDTWHELVKIDPRMIEPPISHAHPPDTYLMFDRSGQLWLAGSAGVLRSSPEIWRANPPFEELTRRGEWFTRADGLTPGAVQSPLFEDREGNVWVATDGGLNRFSHNNLQLSDVPAPFGNGGSGVAALDAGAVLVATEPPHDLLLEIRDGKVVWSRPSQPFTSIYRAPDASIWLGSVGALGHLVHGQLSMTLLPEEARQLEVQTMTLDRTGALWVSVVRKGVFRLSNGRWELYGGLAELPRLPAIVATTDAAGVLWFGYTDNSIVRVDGASVHLFGTDDGLDVGNVTAISSTPSGLWVGGELGLEHFDGTRFWPIRTATAADLFGISGIVEADTGDIWINGNAGLVRLPKGEIAKAMHGRERRVHDELFNYLDGVRGEATQVRPTPSLIKATDGRLWFSTTQTLASIDPSHIGHNPLPPPVTIWSVTARSTTYPVTSAELHLPVHTKDLRIDYTAGSLTMPERVRFRYRLDGYDSDWQDAGDRRAAFYTNLTPGQYAFHVIASNNDGVWNNTGASVSFIINPAFYQTRWFYTLCVLACFVLLFIAYKARLRYVSAQVRRRLEERLAERERIARELHDTLLQGVQGLILRFQAVASRIPKHEPAQELMERALERADQLLGESRDRVKELRGSAAEGMELPHALAAEGNQLAQVHAARFRASVEGVQRDLHPIVREEAFLIAREALANAFRHADAELVEAEVSYADAALHVRIRDDGHGIAVGVLQTGERPGHFGLRGMRERAERIRARLDIWSKPDAGTEVDLRVPAEVAYKRLQLAPHRSSSERNHAYPSAERR